MTTIPVTAPALITTTGTVVTMAAVDAVLDSTGQAFAPVSLAHTYTYTASNQVQTDTCTDGVHTWVKTYSYTGSNLQTVSAWVRQ